MIFQFAKIHIIREMAKSDSLQEPLFSVMESCHAVSVSPLIAVTIYSSSRYFYTTSFYLRNNNRHISFLLKT